MSSTPVSDGPVAPGARADGVGDPKPATTSSPQVPTASPEQIDALHRQGQALENASPEEILTWAVETYFPKLTMATAFGPEGCLILSMLAKIEPRTYVFNLETGYQFPETHALRDRIGEKYGIEVDYQQAELSVEQFEAAHAGPLYRSNPDKCCFHRKIEVLHRVCRDYDAWMSGIRRDQGPTRANTPIVGWDKKFGLVKISPLANWTKKQVWDRIVKDGVPYNPLHDRGYPSVGCRPCTHPVLPGQDERAGRWSGTAKTECGLHLMDD